MSNKDIEPIITGDGSHSVKNNLLNETYHSQLGSIRESLHVYVKNGLEFYNSEFHNDNIQIGELGFGTGLNAWLTSCWAFENKISINYDVFDTFILPENIWSILNYPAILFKEYQSDFFRIHEAEWNVPIGIHPYFTINKRNIDFLLFEDKQRFDVFYYDAFAPAKQPELWDEYALNKCFHLMRNNSVWVSYASNGNMRRSLQTFNWKVERLFGPSGKKHMTRAIKFEF